TDGNIYRKAFTNGSWNSFWDSLAAPSVGVTSAPAISSRQSGSLDVFVVGNDGNLWRKTFSQNSWGSWTKHTAPTTLTGSPAAVATGSTQTNIAVRASNGSLRRGVLAGVSTVTWSTIGTASDSGTGSPA